MNQIACCASLMSSNRSLTKYWANKQRKLENACLQVKLHENVVVFVPEQEAGCEFLTLSSF